MTDIATVLRSLASQENCDGEPYDEMMQAADYIRELQAKLAAAESLHWAQLNPGLADQYRAEALACRVELGFAEDSDEVSPRELQDAISRLIKSDSLDEHTLAVKIGHLQCARNNVQDALESQISTLQWINTILGVIPEAGDSHHE